MTMELEKRDAVLLSLKMGVKDHKVRNGEDLEVKRQGNRFIPEPPEGKQPCQHLDFHPVRPI